VAQSVKGPPREAIDAADPTGEFVREALWYHGLAILAGAHECSTRLADTHGTQLLGLFSLMSAKFFDGKPFSAARCHKRISGSVREINIYKVAPVFRYSHSLCLISPVANFHRLRLPGGSNHKGGGTSKQVMRPDWIERWRPE
jgi:hypothetical protein